MSQAVSSPLSELPAFLTLFQDFLAALSNVDGGEMLYALYADEAPVALDGRLLSCCKADKARFTRVHREISVQGAGVLPVFVQAAPLRAHLEADGGRAVVWYRVQELGSDRPVTAALGLRYTTGGWHVGWCLLAPAMRDWSYSEGLLQTLAEYPWMLAGKPALPRCGLDASYFRHFWRPEVRLDTLPGARFSCHMSAACCKHDYDIALPPAAQILIDAIPWERFQPSLKGTQLAVRTDGQLELKKNNETCRFLGENRQCLIHGTLGHQPFGPCAVFPFAFAQTPEGIAVSASFICGSVRNRLGTPLAERQEDLRERLYLAPVRQPSGFRLAPGMTVSWEVFRDVEAALREVLGQDELPLYQRLYVGNRLLDALRRGEPDNLNAWLAEPPGELTDEFRATLRVFIGNILAWDRLALRRLPAEAQADLRHDRLRDAPLVTAMLQNLLFCKVYSYPYDLTTAHNMAILLYLLTLIMQAACDAPLPDVMWQELSSLGEHGLLKSLLPDTASQGWREFLGSSEFGQWALWYPRA